MKLIAKNNLAAQVYDQVKSDIFEFRLLPGDRFSENEIAARTGVSRTPVREALFKLEQEGYLTVSARNGWAVKPFDFEALENLYDLRVILELAAVRKLVERPDKPDLEALKEIWLVTPDKRLKDPVRVCTLDEAFHQDLVRAAGNPEIARVHRDLTERIRIVRRLDFTEAPRIDATYDEHAQILRCIIRRRADQVSLLLRSHIEASKSVVRRITLHRLHSARAALPVRTARRTGAA
jgi:DNA-binding GntR family transcriptional regulator